MDNKNFEQKNNEVKEKKETFKITIPPELSETRTKATDQEMLLTINELIIHRLLDGAKLSNHKHLKTWPGVLVDGDNRTKLTVVYNANEMDGNEAEDYIYNRKFDSDKVIIIKRESVPSFK